MAKEKIQMVDDDEVENVGIMAGFMDDFEDILEEMMGEEGDDADMANMMNRRPDSPEILMNNLRGDIRSLDARREELADLVGYNAAAETPEGVLALLQPILAQQQAAAAMPPMAPPPVAPPGASPAGPSMPPAGAGGIASLPMDQGPMSPPIMDQGPAPMGMAKGGYVQSFQEGSGEAGVTPADGASYSPDIVEMANAAIRSRLAQEPATLPDVAARTEELYPEYERLLGGGGKDAAQAQMLFDIAQAALGYAGNVGPGGQPLRGSQAARLAGAVSQLPGKIGATAAGMSKEARTLKLAAMQRAEQERAAVQAANTQLSEQQADLYKEIVKTTGTRPMSEVEKTAYGITGDSAKLPWVMKNGAPSLPGGYPTPSAVPDPEAIALESYMGSMGTKLSEQRLEYAKSASLLPDIANLQILSKAAGEGRANEVLTNLFPAYNEVGAAYRSVVSRLLPQMRAPGSGAQSDKDIEVLRQGFGGLADTADVRELVLTTMQNKAQLDKEKLDIMAKIGMPADEGGISIMEANRLITDLNNRSVMTPSLMAALEKIVPSELMESIYSGAAQSTIRTPEEIAAAISGAQPARGN